MLLSLFLLREGEGTRRTEKRLYRISLFPGVSIQAFFLFPFVFFCSLFLGSTLKKITAMPHSEWSLCLFDFLIQFFFQIPVLFQFFFYRIQNDIKRLLSVIRPAVLSKHIERFVHVEHQLPVFLFDSVRFFQVVFKDIFSARSLVRISGDVAFDEVEPCVKAISPVPGGVGGVTSCVLIGHVVEAAKRAAGQV